MSCAIKILTCATTGVWNGTCACPTNYYWNASTSICVIKKLWNATCLTSAECYDGGYLSCQPSAALNTTVCDCGSKFYYCFYLHLILFCFLIRLYLLLDRFS